MNKQDKLAFILKYGSFPECLRIMKYHEDDLLKFAFLNFDWEIQLIQYLQLVGSTWNGGVVIANESSTLTILENITNDDFYEDMIHNIKEKIYTKEDAEECFFEWLDIAKEIYE
jgi:hypothetical protein